MQRGFALLGRVKIIRGKRPGRVQGRAIGVCGALVSSVDVEVHLLSAFFGGD